MISFKRFREFLRVAFGPKVYWRDYLEILKAAFQIVRSPYSEEMWKSRMYICYRCPIFNKGNKTCGRFPNSNLGCGCYVPYKALVKHHCWGRENLGENFGW